MSIQSVDSRNTSMRSFISVGVFNLDIFKYSTSLSSNLVTVGTLVAHPDATVLNCKKGHVLRVNGRKLYPGANPGVTTYMVGVFDSKSFITGFIDPNSPLFAVYNTDKSYFIADGTDPGPGGATDNGAPVYTNGSVTAGTQLTLASGTRNITYVASTTTYDFTSFSSAFYQFTAQGIVTFTAAATVPPSGTMLSIFFKGPYAITFGATTIVPSSTSVTPVTTGAVLINFVSNGTALVEMSRVVLLVVSPPTPITGTA